MGHLREAIEVGRVMEELNFRWLEEPMPEQRMHLYQELCRTLVMPVMATECLMHDMELTAQWLLQGAQVELNGAGGLFGLVHAHMGYCIDNTDYYAFMGAAADALAQQGRRWGMVNAPVLGDDYIAHHRTAPDGGAKWDEAVFQCLITTPY